MNPTTWSGSAFVVASDSMSVAESTTIAPTQSRPASVRRRGFARRRGATSVTPRTVVERGHRTWPGSLVPMTTEPLVEPTAPPVPTPDLGPAAPVAPAPDGAGRGAARESFGPARFLNRELSWLEFAARVLALADEETLPLLERSKFLAIFSTGLDEFFQVRVAGLKNQLDAGRRQRFPDGRSSVLETLEALREQVTGLVERHARIFNDAVRPGLSAAGIEIVDYVDLGHADQRRLRHHFERDMFPVLTPLAVDPGHPFPYISNLSLNLAVSVEDPVTGRGPFRPGEGPAVAPALRAHRRRALRAPRAGDRGEPQRPVPRDADRVVLTPSGSRATPTSTSTTPRTTTCWPRSSSSCAGGVSAGPCASRSGRGCPRRSSSSCAASSSSARSTSTASAAPLDLGQLWAIAALDRPDLSLPSYSPRTPPRLMTETGAPVDIFALLRERDVLVHHPYDSFASSVEEFISQAAEDPDVLAIKQTLYRTSGDRPVRAAARPRRRGRQAGRRPRRAAGALRRAAQHRLGPAARGGRRPRRLRRRRAEDALQDVARGAPGGRRDPPLLPRRHRQLQLATRPASTRTSGCSPPTPSSARTSPPSSTT